MDMTVQPYTREELDHFRHLLDTGDGTLVRSVVRRLIESAQAGIEDRERLDWLAHNPPHKGMRPMTSVSREQIDAERRVGIVEYLRVHKLPVTPPSDDAARGAGTPTAPDEDFHERAWEYEGVASCGRCQNDLPCEQHAHLFPDLAKGRTTPKSTLRRRRDTQKASER